MQNPTRSVLAVTLLLLAPSCGEDRAARPETRAFFAQQDPGVLMAAADLEALREAALEARPLTLLRDPEWAEHYRELDRAGRWSWVAEGGFDALEALASLRYTHFAAYLGGRREGGDPSSTIDAVWTMDLGDAAGSFSDWIDLAEPEGFEVPHVLQDGLLRFGSESRLAGGGAGWRNPPSAPLWLRLDAGAVVSAFRELADCGLEDLYYESRRAQETLAAIRDVGLNLDRSVLTVEAGPRGGVWHGEARLEGPDLVSGSSGSIGSRILGYLPEGSHAHLVMHLDTQLLADWLSAAMGEDELEDMTQELRASPLTILSWFSGDVLLAARLEETPLPTLTLVATLNDVARFIVQGFVKLMTEKLSLSYMEGADACWDVPVPDAPVPGMTLTVAIGQGALIVSTDRAIVENLVGGGGERLERVGWSFEPLEGGEDPGAFEHLFGPALEDLAELPQIEIPVMKREWLPGADLLARHLPVYSVSLARESDSALVLQERGLPLACIGAGVAAVWWYAEGDSVSRARR